ncbi:NusA-like transcription termination signal-binding factor [Candidatus Woesearchaeota archaeon]|nr:NusA-like transcription termination signal-binding factor [Candidatus Woesearchaeota archaeon]
MTKIVYDTNAMQAMALFENITRAKVKDYFDDPVQGRLVFIVLPGELWKALGKGSSNVKRLEQAFKKKIKIVEFSDDVLKFISNMAHPLKVKSVTRDSADQEIIVIDGGDVQTRGLLIGRNAKNLRNLEVNVRRFFDVKEIKVV